MNLYRKITIEIDEGNHVKHIEMSNEELMKQIKLNEELKQKVNGLQEERDYLYNKLNSECKRLQKLLDFEIERNDLKQDIIDKAIEFIDKYCIDDEFYINLTNKEKSILEVKKILQGSDKDVLD